MARMAARGTKIVINLKMEAQTLPPSVSRNTVAEIRGSVYPEQVLHPVHTLGGIYSGNQALPSILTHFSFFCHCPLLFLFFIMIIFQATNTKKEKENSLYPGVAPYMLLTGSHFWQRGQDFQIPA